MFSDDIQSRLQTLTDLERTAREDCITLKSKLVNVETQLSDAMREKDQLRLQIDRLQTEHMLKEQDLRRYDKFILIRFFYIALYLKFTFGG